MSTSDWKAELRGRIAKIREKKAAEREIRQHAAAQGSPQAAAAPAALPADEPAEVDRAPPRPVEIVSDPGGKPVPREMKSPVVQIAPEVERNEAEEEHEPAKGAAMDSEAVEDDRLEPAPEGVEARAEEPVQNSEEPTLFPMQSQVDGDDEKKSAAAEGRKQIKEIPVAPVASGHEAALDSYTPLDHHSQPEAGGEQLPSERAAGSSDLEIPFSRNFRRLIAAAFDGAVIAATEVLLLLVAGVLLDTGPLQLLNQSLLPLSIMFLCLQFLYYVIFTSAAGQTPGKMILRLRVVRGQGEGVGLLYAVARWTAMIFALLPLGTGYLWMYSRPDGRSWHDLLLRMTVEDSG